MKDTPDKKAAAVAKAAQRYADLRTSKDRENALLDAVSDLIGKKLKIVPAAESPPNG
jgi:hypothetical protein